MPLTPAVLALRLAQWIDRQASERVRIGFDGFAEVGTSELADLVAAELDALQRPAVRVSTAWWWRSAALRLEYGRQDLESRMSGWIDVGSLRREVFNPLAPNGTGRHLTQLKDPATDRAIRQSYRMAPENAVLILDGPLLGTHQLELDGIVQIGVSVGRLERALPAARQWEIAAVAEYRDRFLPAHPFGGPTVVVSYEHPASPAARGLDLR